MNENRCLGPLIFSIMFIFFMALIFQTYGLCWVSDLGSSWPILQWPSCIVLQTEEWWGKSAILLWHEQQENPETFHLLCFPFTLHHVEGNFMFPCFGASLEEAVTTFQSRVSFSLTLDPFWWHKRKKTRYPPRLKRSGYIVSWWLPEKASDL